MPLRGQSCADMYMRYPRMKFIFQQAFVLWQSESREIVKSRQGGEGVLQPVP
jgi:hypothetical protein